MKMRRAGVGVVAAVGVGLLAMAAVAGGPGPGQARVQVPRGEDAHLQDDHEDEPDDDLMAGWRSPPRSRRRSSHRRSTASGRGDATLPVREKVESHRNELSLPGGIQITYDSKDPDAKIDNEQLKFLEDLFKLAGQIDYTVIVDAKNKVKAVEGTEKLLEKADKLNPRCSATRCAAALQADKLKAKFEQTHGNLPDVLARPGEPWERTETMDTGGQEFHLPQEVRIRRAPRRRGTRPSTRSPPR